MPPSVPLVHHGASLGPLQVNELNQAPPNTYVFTTAGPQVKVDMGNCMTNLMASSSANLAYAGSFAPPLPQSVAQSSCSYQ